MNPRSRRRSGGAGCGRPPRPAGTPKVRTYDRGDDVSGEPFVDLARRVWVSQAGWDDCVLERPKMPCQPGISGLRGASR
jgi:hypothetical protein